MSRKNLRIKQELTVAKEYLQSIIDEQETTNDKLKFANAEKVLNLAPTDLGRTLRDIKLSLDIPNLRHKLIDVIDTMQTLEFEAQSFDSAVAAFIDIAQLKNHIQKIHEVSAYTAAIVDTIREPLLVIDAELRVKTANESFYQIFQATREQTEGIFLHNLGNGQWNIPKLRQLFKRSFSPAASSIHSPIHLLTGKPGFPRSYSSRRLGSMAFASYAEYLSTMGFPTGLKWRTIIEHPCSIRYAVCNAAEGESGTFKDRWLIRKNPYAVIEL